MSLQEKDQMIDQLKIELQKCRFDHEEYKKQCKVLEQLLEDENKKKETEIKKLKSEAIQKLKDSQSQVSKEVEIRDKKIAELNQQINKNSEGSNVEAIKNKQLEEQIKKVQDTLGLEKDKVKQLNDKITSLQTELEQIKEIEKNLKIQLELSHTQLSQAKDTIQQGKSQIMNLQAQLEKTNIKLASSPSKSESKKGQGSDSKKPAKDSPNLNSAQINTLKQQNKKAQKQIQSLRLQLSKLRQSQSKPNKKVSDIDPEQYRILQRTCKDLKYRVGQLIEQKNNLQQSFKLTDLKPTKQLISNKPVLKSKSHTFSVFLTTKKHYISPFLQFNGKVIRVLKQNRNSFEKCLGSLKFNVDNITYDVKQLAHNSIQQIAIPSFQNHKQVEKIENGDVSEDIQQPIQSQMGVEQIQLKTISILILGAKHTSKRSIFLQSIEQFVQKIKSSADSLKGVEIKFGVYKNKLNQIPADVSQEFVLTIETLDENLKKALSLFASKQASSPRKVIVKQKQKPKNQLCYFSISLGEKLTVQFITSSNINQIRQSDKLLNSLENAIFHHLPFPSETERQYHFILTINPIVQQYQNCRLCLSLVNQPLGERKEQIQFQQTLSPMKDQFISETVKKRIQSCEKETEQQSLKVQRMQNQIHLYRTKIEQVLLRVKNIISVQGKNTPYLKKSPIVLTLQKLQRSLYSIIQRPANKSRRVGSEQKEEDGEEYENYEQNNEQDYHQSSQEQLL